MRWRSNCQRTQIKPRGVVTYSAAVVTVWWFWWCRELLSFTGLSLSHKGGWMWTGQPGWRSTSWHRLVNFCRYRHGIVIAGYSEQIMANVDWFCLTVVLMPKVFLHQSISCIILSHMYWVEACRSLDFRKQVGLYPQSRISLGPSFTPALSASLFSMFVKDVFACSMHNLSPTYQ